jgi:hypothetical protein
MKIVRNSNVFQNTQQDDRFSVSYKLELLDSRPTVMGVTPGDEGLQPPEFEMGVANVLRPSNIKCNLQRLTT